jgi:hypothetical protein
MIQKVVRDLSAPTTLAAAATTDLGSKDETFITLTGTAATITALGTVSAGIYKWVVANAAHVLTHNATSLILPASANITAADGDVALFLSLGSGNWKCLNYMKANGGNIGVVSAVAGTAAAPGMNFVTDTNTGFYLAAADAVGVAVGGVTAGNWSTSATTISSYTGTNISIAPSQAAVNTAAPNIAITAPAVAGGSSSGNGGSVTITAGNSATNSTAGSITLSAGDNTGGDSGSIVLTPGAGNSTAESGSVKLNDDAGNVVLGVNGKSAHVFTSGDAGTPSVSGAGTLPTVLGSDFAFRVTLGETPTTAVTATFAVPFAAAPIVHAQYQTSNIACRAESTTTNVVITFASTPAETGVLEVICIGTSVG